MCKITMPYGVIHLTSREVETLNYLLTGAKIKEIANSLVLSPRTIEAYLRNIRLKLNCKNTSVLVKLISKSGFIEQLKYQKQSVTQPQSPNKIKGFHLGHPYEGVYFLQHELSTMKELIKGISNRKAAEALGISHRSVGHYIVKMREKMRCFNKAHLIREFLKTELAKSMYNKSED